MKTKTSLAFLALAFLVPAAFFLTGFAKENEIVRHIVVFKYKTSATQAEIKQVTEAFSALQNKIPGIVSFESGVNNSPEKMNKGFTHIYQITFKDANARDQYLPHPEHKKFGELLGKLGIHEEIFVVDYTPGQN